VPARAAWFAGNHGSFFSARFLPTTLVQYLRPDTVRFERLLPFVRYGPLASDRGSYPMETITPSASITTTATLLLATALLGAGALVARRAWVPLALLFGTAIAAVPTFMIGFIGHRYLVDMLPMLMLPAAFAFAAVAVPNVGWARAAQVLTVALVVWGTWTNVALATWTQNLKEPGFTEWRYRLDDVLFGNPPPALIVHDPDAPVARDGVVALSLGADGERCDGVYIGEQGNWVPLERSNNGIRRIAGTLRAEGTSTMVVGGDTWTLAAERESDGDDVRFVLSSEAGTTVGELVHLAADGTLNVEVVADEIAGEFAVTVDGETALFSFAVPTGAMVPSTSLTPSTDPGDSLCRRLQARL
jgi:hypothetical protein